MLTNLQTAELDAHKLAERGQAEALAEIHHCYEDASMEANRLKVTLESTSTECEVHHIPPEHINHHQVLCSTLLFTMRFIYSNPLLPTNRKANAPSRNSRQALGSGSRSFRYG